MIYHHKEKEVKYDIIGDDDCAFFFKIILCFIQ